MRIITWTISLWLAFIAAVLQADTQSTTLRLVTTTSAYDSGLINYLKAIYEEKRPIRIDVTSVGTGAALKMGKKGQADVIIAHSPEAELNFMATDYGFQRHYLMSNDYVIVGPKSDPARVALSTSIEEALQKIANNQSLFLSRADDSGTHRKELDLWQQAGIKPLMSPWYYEAGCGMSYCLELAESKKAYLLVDRATMLVDGVKDFDIVFEGGAELHDPYHVIVVKPQDAVAKARLAESKSFVDWLVSGEGRKEIVAFAPSGHQLYHFEPSLDDAGNTKKSP